MKETSNNLDKTWDEIGYLQIGDNPGWNEPTTGKMNYKNIFRHIYNKGFKGYWVWNMAMQNLAKRANWL